MGSSSLAGAGHREQAQEEISPRRSRAAPQGRPREPDAAPAFHLHGPGCIPEFSQAEGEWDQKQGNVFAPEFQASEDPSRLRVSAQREK